MWAHSLHLLPCTGFPQGAQWTLWLSMVHLTRRADIWDSGSSLVFMMSINRANIARFLPREDKDCCHKHCCTRVLLSIARSNNNCKRSKPLVCSLARVFAIYIIGIYIEFVLCSFCRQPGCLQFKRLLEGFFISGQ